MKEIIEKIKELKTTIPKWCDPETGTGMDSYNKAIDDVINLLEPEGRDICDKCNGTGYIEHYCDPKHIKTLIPYKTNGLDETIYISQCKCGQYYWERSQIDPGAGSSHEYVEIDDELATKYLENFISGYQVPELRR